MYPDTSTATFGRGDIPAKSRPRKGNRRKTRSREIAELLLADPSKAVILKIDGISLHPHVSQVRDVLRQIDPKWFEKWQAYRSLHADGPATYWLMPIDTTRGDKPQP